MSILSDALTLAKAGFKASEISEMLKDQPKEEPIPEPKEEPIPEPEEELIPEPKEEPIPEPDKDKEIAELREQLKNAQNANRRENLAGSEKSDDDILAEAVRRFM